MIECVILRQECATCLLCLWKITPCIACPNMATNRYTVINSLLDAANRLKNGFDPDSRNLTTDIKTSPEADGLH